MDDVKRIVQKLPSCLAATSSIGHEPQIEVEARIRGPIVNDISLRRLLSYGEWDTLEYTEQKRISTTNRKCTYRYRQYTSAATRGIVAASSRHEIICKSSLMVTDVPDSWCTVHVSTEIPMPSMLQSLQTVKANTITRYRRVINDHFVDVTDDGDIQRVEIESSEYTVDCDAMINTVIEVCRVMQDSAVMVGRLDWTSLMHIVSTTYNTFCLDTRSYQKPITMTSRDLWRVLRNSKTKDFLDYLVTPKIDGVRQFILIMGDKAYSIDLTKDIRYLCDITNDSQEDYDDSVIILDCEYLEDKYYIIDIVVFNGKYIGNVPFYNRQTLIQAARQLLAPEIRIVYKPYNTFNSFQQLVQIYNCWLTEYKIDGLIFVHEDKPYMQQVLKWKNDNTVDLEVVNNTDGYALMTCDGWSIDIPFVLQPTTSSLPQPWVGSGVHSKVLAGIWEFKYKNNVLIPTRPRPDKPQANSLFIVTKNIKESVPGSIFDGTGCFMMRKYHNRVKTDMLHPVHGTILDIGTGQGGDISKWKDATSVYCVEPDADAIQEMRSRLLDQQNIYVNNCLLRDLEPDDIPENISIFAAFFCVNQWNKDDWTKLVKIIQTKGTRRCRFVTTALTHPEAGNNTCWKLNFISEEQYDISIHNTRITNIKETALSMKMLDDRMKECNMTRVNSWRLNTSDAMTQYEMQLSSMYTAITYQRGYVEHPRS